jgi:hypothetical protein
MKGLKGSGGYTIIETMFFLVVSLALFASVVGVYASQNRRTQFTQSVNNFDQKIRDVLNDVETGYYPTLDNVRCSASGGGVSIETAEAGETIGQGTNDGCVFAGKAIQLYPPNSGDYDIYTLAANRDATSISSSGARAITSVFDKGSLGAGLEISEIKTSTGSHSGLAVVSSFGEDVSAGNSGRGNRTLLATLNGSIASGMPLSITTSNTAQGVLICLQEPGGGRTATILVGGNDEARTVVNIDGECSF